MKNIVSLLPLLFLLAGCGSNTQKATQAELPIYDETAARDSTQGFVGVFKVPEMLVMSVLDSADVRNVALKVAESYSVLGEEMKASNAEQDGPPGQIMYNNDPKNFKFECFSAIKKIPLLQTSRCKVSTLPSADMLVFNYYGPYQALYLAYNECRAYLKQNRLEQSGEVREFYITDPTQVSDSTKWLTKVMVPVIPLKKKEKE